MYSGITLTKGIPDFAIKKMGLSRFDRDTHQIKLKTETATFVNGGPYKSFMD
jgi:hypothetical protein